MPTCMGSCGFQRAFLSEEHGTVKRAPKPRGAVGEPPNLGCHIKFVRVHFYKILIFQQILSVLLPAICKFSVSAKRIRFIVAIYFSPFLYFTTSFKSLICFCWLISITNGISFPIGFATSNTSFILLSIFNSKTPIPVCSVK